MKTMKIFDQFGILRTVSKTFICVKGGRKGQERLQEFKRVILAVPQKIQNNSDSQKQAGIL